MKKRLNIFCVCMIAAFLLSVSGNVYLIIEMFINGVEVGMKAAQGEITEIPQYKMVHVLPTDMMETTNSHQLERRQTTGCQTDYSSCGMPLFPFQPWL